MRNCVNFFFKKGPFPTKCTTIDNFTSLPYTITGYDQLTVTVLETLVLTLLLNKISQELLAYRRNSLLYKALKVVLKRTQTCSGSVCYFLSFDSAVQCLLLVGLKFGYAEVLRLCSAWFGRTIYPRISGFLRMFGSSISKSLSCSVFLGSWHHRYI